MPSQPKCRQCNSRHGALIPQSLARRPSKKLSPIDALPLKSQLKHSDSLSALQLGALPTVWEHLMRALAKEHLNLKVVCAVYVAVNSSQRCLLPAPKGPYCVCSVLASAPAAGERGGLSYNSPWNTKWCRNSPLLHPHPHPVADFRPPCPLTPASPLPYPGKLRSTSCCHRPPLGSSCKLQATLPPAAAALAVAALCSRLQLEGCTPLPQGRAPLCGWSRGAGYPGGAFVWLIIGHKVWMRGPCPSMCLVTGRRACGAAKTRAASVGEQGGRGQQGRNEAHSACSATGHFVWKVLLQQSDLSLARASAGSIGSLKVVAAGSGPCLCSTPRLPTKWPAQAVRTDGGNGVSLT